MSASLVEPVTQNAGRAVARYVVVATAARLGDAGGAIGVLLLTVARFGPGAGPVVGGLLAAALTAPHALGPWTGRLLDRSADRRRVLGPACGVFGVALVLGAALVHAGRPLAAAAAFATAGAAGPLLTGGFSSLVSGFGGDVDRVRGLDAVTYGVAGTAGPAVVATLAAAASPMTALVVVGAVVVLAGLAVGAIPRPPRTTDRAVRPAPGRTDRPAPGPAPAPRQRWLLLRSRPLRQVTVTTVAAAATGGALGVVAVLLGAHLIGGSAAGGWCVTALGAGNLAGAVAVVWRPLRGEPVRRSLQLAVVLGVLTAAVAGAWTFGVAVAAFALVGLVTAPWVTATLAARERYAPPGRTGEVFVALAGVKVAGGSAGTALAGLMSGWGGRPLALVAGAVVLVAVLAVSRRAAAPPPAPA